MKRIDVLKGIEQILVQKAYEIGHISHRADGDWQKQADGSWKPYKGQSTPQAQEPTENTEYGEITEEDLYNADQVDLSGYANNINIDDGVADNDDLEDVANQILIDNNLEITDENMNKARNAMLSWLDTNGYLDSDDLETPIKNKLYGDDEVDYTYAKDIDYNQYDDDIKSIEFRENDDGEFEPHDDDYFRVADKIYEQTDHEDMSDEEADQLYDEIVDRVIDRAYELHNNVQKSAVRDMRSTPTTKNMGF